MCARLETEKCASTEDADHRQAIDALAALLENEASPVETAKAIASAYDDYLLAMPDPKNNNKVYIFWVLYMCHAIRNFGDAAVQGCLINLHKAMSELPDVNNLDGSIRRGPGGAIYWRELAYWPFAFVDHGLQYNDPVEFASDEATEFYFQAPLLLNGTNFGAAILERGIDTRKLPAEADSFLKLGIEQAYSEKRRETE
ncbi:Hypothetical protein R9X50_00767600 [Acrodontium crateriforme]|uniref:Uncharacterized protein n=1 Tax=Acrodontium crateriforme TaxID=150365 RepID=A0AAQ3MD40_9PEZI|nr:Hypothetical protein R9X50_00767600 [Acrodontium crateriforme]